MSSVLWYETLEGKLAMSLALLLVFVAVFIFREETNLTANPSTGVHATPAEWVAPPMGADLLGELPLLTPHEISDYSEPPEPQPPRDNPEQLTDRTKKNETPAPQQTSPQTKPQPPPDQKQQRSFFDSLLR